MYFIWLDYFVTALLAMTEAQDCRELTDSRLKISLI
jgi:hypothetical protein